VGDAPRPAREDQHPISQTHRLARVVRDEENGQPGLRPEPFQLLVQQVARDGVERRERLIHQEHVGVLRQRTGKSYPLLHATRQLVRAALFETVEVDPVKQLGRHPGARRVADSPKLEGELDVAGRREPRQQCSLLEHQRHAAVNVGPAVRRALEAREHVEERALPRS